jgi:GT2 family glycosyltransferase
MGEKDRIENQSAPSFLPSSTLIISSRNRPQLLLETVESVLQGNEVPNELVIIDQSDTPHPILSTRTLERGCWVRYIHSQTRGVSRARNEGMRVASNDLLVLMDDDFLAPEDWYGLIVKILAQSGPSHVITGRVLPGAAEKAGGFVPALVEDDRPAVFSGRIGTDVLPSCHMAMYRSTFLKVGGFDERLGPGTRFPAADDNDYGFRLLEAGFTIIYAPEATLFHRAWRGKNEYYPMRWAYGRAKGGFYTKYLNLQDRYMLGRMIRDLTIRFIRFPWRFMHKPRLAIGDLYYAFGILSGCLEWFWTYKLNFYFRP